MLRHVQWWNPRWICIRIWTSCSYSYSYCGLLTSWLTRKWSTNEYCVALGKKSISCSTWSLLEIMSSSTSWTVHMYRSFDQGCPNFSTSQCVYMSRRRRSCSRRRVKRSNPQDPRVSCCVCIEMSLYTAILCVHAGARPRTLHAFLYYELFLGCTWLPLLSYQAVS